MYRNLDTSEKKADLAESSAPSFIYETTSSERTNFSICFPLKIFTPFSVVYKLCCVKLFTYISVIEVPTECPGVP